MLSLEGCVAAVVPVAASGIIGRSRLRQKHQDAAPRPVARHARRRAGLRCGDVRVDPPGGAGVRRIPCGDKPFAIVAKLGAALTAGAIPYLRSIEMLGLAIVYTSREPSAVVLKQAAALGKAGLEPPVAGQTLFPTAGGKDAATRATAAARYCVVAPVGTTARDFSDAVPPGTSDAHPGWFLIRGD